jgi:hypothetical protein
MTAPKCQPICIRSKCSAAKDDPEQSIAIPLHLFRRSIASAAHGCSSWTHWHLTNSIYSIGTTGPECFSVLLLFEQISRRLDFALIDNISPNILLFVASSTNKTLRANQYDQLFERRCTRSIIIDRIHLIILSKMQEYIFFVMT